MHKRKNDDYHNACFILIPKAKTALSFVYPSYILRVYVVEYKEKLACQAKPATGTHYFIL